MLNSQSAYFFSAAAALRGPLRVRAFVRVRWWRGLHLASMAMVAVQALAGRACFLTVWQDDLSGASGRAPLIMRVVNGRIYWPLPILAFTVAYAAVFVYVLALWKLVPPGGSNRRPSSGRR